MASWETLRESLVAYRDTGRPTGGFLEAVLSNNFMEACGRADDTSQQHFMDIARFIYNDMPGYSHGSCEHYREWISHSGLKGNTDANL